MRFNKANSLAFFAIFVLFIDSSSTTKDGRINIDTKYPILITDKFDHNKSLFGASVILLEPHSYNNFENIEAEDGVTSTGWVLIGAPKAHSSHPNHRNLSEPGVIWRCSLGRSSNENECQQVVIDPTNAYDPKIPKVAHEDWKHGGWLGGSMSMGSDKFVACASRWRNFKFHRKLENSNKKVKTHNMNGICYWIPKPNLQAEQTNGTWPWAPSTGNRTYRLLPLISRERISVPAPNLSEDIYDWGHGQAGFSAHIANENHLILGAPGVYRWTGSVVEYSNESHALDNITSYQRYNHANDSFSHAFVSKPPDGAHYVEYFGYAVTSGRYFSGVNIPTIQYATGAPRADSLVGNVIVFTLKGQDPHARNNTDLAMSQLAKVACEVVKKGGSCFGSYFGSSLCSVDVDGNGFDDLLVGAPKFVLPAEDSLDNGYDGDGGDNYHGCVFVFQSNGTSFLKPKLLCQSRREDSDFGTAISSLGDVNTDGFNDVAIGAPYDNNGRGSVSIYQGSSSGLKFVKKLTPEKIHPSIRGFGYSISPGIDIDRNSYPDMAVGCISSNQVVVYRTIPVLRAAGKIQADVEALWANVGNFNIVSCIHFYGRALPQSLHFVVTITLDVEAKDTKLLIEWDEFSVNVTTGMDVITKTKSLLTFRADFVNGTCYHLPAVKNDTDDIRSVKLHQTFALPPVDPNSGREVSPIHYVISPAADGTASVSLNTSKSDFKTFRHQTPWNLTTVPYEASGSLSYSKQCWNFTSGRNESCRADLSLHIHCAQAEVVNGTMVYLVRSRNELNFHVTVTNLGDFSNPPTLQIFTDQPDILVEGGGSCDMFEDPAMMGQSKGESCWEFGLKKQLRRGEQDRIDVALTVPELYRGLSPDNLTFNFIIISGEFSKTFPHQLSLQYESRIAFDWVQPSLQPLTNKLVPINQDFQVLLKGSSPVFAIQLEFLVPYKVLVGGSKESFLENITINGIMEKQGVTCQFHSDYSLSEKSVSLIHHPESNETVDRWGNSTREFKTNSILPWKRHPDARRATNVTIHCESPSVICALYRCNSFTRVAPSVGSAMKMNLRSKLAVSPKTLKFFGGLVRLEIHTEVLGRILSENNDEVLDSAHKSLVNVLKVSSLGELPAWTVIVGIVFGLMLLFVMIFCLTKCGFFQRTQYESLQKRHKQLHYKNMEQIDDYGMTSDLD